MNTQEGNKLIAEFLGAKANKRTRKTDQGTHQTVYWEGGDVPKLMFGASPSTRELRFHKDWNWLMPVIQKIEKKRVYIGWLKKNGITDSFSSYNCDFILKSFNINKVWKSCVHFIKLYNENCEPLNSKEGCKERDKRYCSYPKCECMPIL